MRKELWMSLVIISAIVILSPSISGLSISENRNVGEGIPSTRNAKRIPLTMDEDTLYQMDLRQYFDEGWERLIVSRNRFLTFNLDDYWLDIKPYKNNWNGLTFFSILVLYNNNSQGQEFTLNVTPINDSPEMRILEPLILMEDEVMTDFINVNDYFYDVDSELIYDAFTLSSSNITSAITIDGYIYLQPIENFYGTESVIIIASDGEYTISQEVEVNILPVNDSPDIICQDSLSFDEDTICEIDLKSIFNDVDSDLDYSLYSQSGHVKFNFSSSNTVIMNTSVEDWNGFDQLTILATDDEYSAKVSLEVYVFPINDPPILMATIDDMEVQEDSMTSINLTDFFYDVDGDDLTYIINSSDNITYNLNNLDGTLVLFPTENWSGEASFEIIASDGRESVSEQVKLNVTSINDGPYLKTNIRPLIMKSGESYLFDSMDYFDDIDSSDLTIDFIGSENVRIAPTETPNIFNISLSDSSGLIEIIRINVSDGADSFETELLLVNANQAGTLENSVSGFYLSLPSLISIIIATSIITIFVSASSKHVLHKKHSS
jgi:hypothetical protein